MSIQERRRTGVHFIWRYTDVLQLKVQKNGREKLMILRSVGSLFCALAILTNLGLGKVIRILFKFACDISAEDEHCRTPTQLANYLSESTSLDMVPLWYNALQKAGVDFEQVLNAEYTHSNAGASTGVDTMLVEQTGLRRRKSPLFQETSHEANAANELCGCHWCFYGSDEKCLSRQAFHDHKYILMSPMFI
jgi:hypothetical protein